MTRQKWFDIIKAAGYRPIDKSKKWYEKNAEFGERLPQLKTLEDEIWINYIYFDILGYRRMDCHYTSLIDEMKLIRKYIRLILRTHRKNTIRLDLEDCYKYKDMYWRPLDNSFVRWVKNIGEETGWWSFSVKIEDYHSTLYCIQANRIYTANDINYLKKTARVLRNIFSKDIAFIITNYLRRYCP